MRALVQGAEPWRANALQRQLFALAILAGSWATAAAQDLLKVAVPQRGVWDAGVPELGMRAGIFQKHGLNLEILYTQAGPESIQALIAGSVDLATAAGVSAAFGTFAKGAPIRIVSNEIAGSPDLYWYVTANSPVRKVEDFNDKTVAYSLTGSSSHAGLLALIAQYNLRVKPTSTGNIPSTLTQTLSGQVEVGFGAVPFALDLAEEGRIRIIITGNDVTSLKTRTGRVNSDQPCDLAEPQGCARSLSSGLQGDHRLDVFRPRRAEAVQRLLQGA